MKLKDLMPLILDDYIKIEYAPNRTIQFNRNLNNVFINKFDEELSLEYLNRNICGIKDKNDFIVLALE